MTDSWAPTSPWWVIATPAPSFKIHCQLNDPDALQSVQTLLRLRCHQQKEARPPPRVILVATAAIIAPVPSIATAPPFFGSNNGRN